MIVEHVASYIAETRRLHTLSTTNEETFYPAVRNLLHGALTDAGLPFEVRTGTSEARRLGVDRPDFVLSDGGPFVAVFGEVKLPDEGMAEMAVSTGRNDQVGRYLSQTGVVLLCNVRGFGLLTCKPGYRRTPGSPVPPAQRELIGSVDLWGSATERAGKLRVDTASVNEFGVLLTRAVTEFAPIAEPASLAKILAFEARDALHALPDTFAAVRPLLDDFQMALGLTFDLDDAKGARFFRSSLVQTAFYSLFAAWVLWDRSQTERPFTLDTLDTYLRIPFLSELFYDLRHPRRLHELGLAPHLVRAVATLHRVDREVFRQHMTFPRIDDASPAAAAITYFYEPFLEAFDPQLKDELGVWYTPPEIVRYQVGRVHHLLKTELGRVRGLADPDVVVLDPCCGTGAYLLEVARCIAAELRAEGEASMIGAELLTALQERVIGFEILTAPFAIAQLQLYVALASLDVVPAAQNRLAVFLTNALTGWQGGETLKINFPELRQEYDASRQVKRRKPIIVVIGNPPYDRFAGAAIDEEGDLVDRYKGIRRRPKKDRKGKVVHGKDGKAVMVQDGSSLLYEEFGVRKQLLDDLYIRFFRLAEERIGETASHGIVSYIANSSYLTGRSHPLMRRSLLMNFHAGWIDNLNGDKFKTGKVIPRGLPGEGRSDQSAFTTPMNPGGIQPGTAVSTWLKRTSARTGPEETVVQYRDFWGSAEWKRRTLEASLPAGESPAGSDTPAFQRIYPSSENRWRLSPHTFEGGYEAWPALDELFPTAFQGVNHNRGLEGSIIDTDRANLAARMRSYIEAPSFADAVELAPGLGESFAGYKPESVWTSLRANGFDEAKLLPFLTFPFDERWLYYEAEGKLLNRSRPEFGENLAGNEFLVTVPEPRKDSETRPVFARTLVNLHVHERGSVVIPREVRQEGLFAGQQANLAENAWSVFRVAFGIDGERTDEPARTFVSRLFRVTLAILYAPAYQREHRSALGADWAHLPVPKNLELLDRLAEAGATVATLLDMTADPRAALEATLGRARLAALAGPSRVGGGQVRPEEMRLTITYFASAKGRWIPRAYASSEEPLPSWGERTGDLYISDGVFFANVPEAVWSYELGGYPVLKKWLAYRQADRREDRPLSAAEWRSFRGIVQRIAALLTLEPLLDELYMESSAEAFTRNELSL